MEIEPVLRRRLIWIGVIMALLEWAAALGARYALGPPRVLLIMAASMLGLTILMGSFLQIGPMGKGAFWRNWRAAFLFYGAVILGAFLFTFGPISGLVWALVVTPVAATAMALKQTWPLPPRWPAK